MYAWFNFSTQTMLIYVCCIDIFKMIKRIPSACVAFFYILTCCTCESSLLTIKLEV